jgi:hypothetical protein
VGGILAVMQLLTIVLSCCLVANYSQVYLMSDPKSKKYEISVMEDVSVNILKHESAPKSLLIFEYSNSL